MDSTEMWILAKTPIAQISLRLSPLGPGLSHLTFWLPEG